MNVPTAHPRAGKTLIELLVIIATASTILTTAGQLLFRVSRTERAVREAGPISRAELRLVRDLRSDVRSATKAEASDAGEDQRLHLTLAAGEIEYRAADEGVERRTATSRELYRLGSVESHFRNEGRFVALEVKPRRQAPGFANAAADEFRIVAAIGADIRSSSSQKIAPRSTARPVEAPIPERREP